MVYGSPVSYSSEYDFQNLSEISVGIQIVIVGKAVQCISLQSHGNYK